MVGAQGAITTVRGPSHRGLNRRLRLHPQRADDADHQQGDAGQGQRRVGPRVYSVEFGRAVVRALVDRR